VPPHAGNDRANFFVVTDKTTSSECEAAFRRFATRDDVVRVEREGGRGEW
jgi:hypothetical protein